MMINSISRDYFLRLIFVMHFVRDPQWRRPLRGFRSTSSIFPHHKLYVTFSNRIPWDRPVSKLRCRVVRKINAWFSIRYLWKDNFRYLSRVVERGWCLVPIAIGNNLSSGTSPSLTDRGNTFFSHQHFTVVQFQRPHSSLLSVFIARYIPNNYTKPQRLYGTRLS